MNQANWSNFIAMIAEQHREKMDVLRSILEKLEEIKEQNIRTM